jgi:cytochrome d ubiquinol oxidase subunit II
MILSAVCGLGVVALLVGGARRGARVLAVGAVAGVVWGWGVAQFPYLLPEKLTISAGAAPSDTLTGVLVVFGAAVVLVVPAMGLLYTLSQRSMLLEGETESRGT